MGFEYFRIYEIQIFGAPRQEKNFQVMREYDFRGNVTKETNVLYEIWKSAQQSPQGARPELQFYFPDFQKKGIWGRWKDKTLVEWAQSEGYLEDPRLHQYRPQEETVTPELKDAFDSRRDLQRRFTDDDKLREWAEKFGSVDDPRLEAYRPGRTQANAEARGAYQEKGRLTENLARGAKAAVSSQLGNSYHPAFATDGRENTRWLSSNYVNGSSDTEFFTLDLGREVALDEIRVDTGARAGVSHNERLRRFMVSVSTDGTNYTPVKEVKGLDSLGWLTVNLGASPPRARYVKLHGFDTEGKYYAALAEVEVYGIVERNETVTDVTGNGIRTRTVRDEIGIVLEEKWDASGRKISSKIRSGLTENLALGRSVTYSSQYNNNWSAVRAVDGKEGPYAWMSSSQTEAAWLQVDLGSERKV